MAEGIETRHRKACRSRQGGRCNCTPGDSGPNTTVAQAVDELLEGMRDGRILTRSGKRYRPSTIRGYQQAAERFVKPALAPRTLGQRRVSEVRRRDVQDLIEELRGKG